MQPVGRIARSLKVSDNSVKVSKRNLSVKISEDRKRAVKKYGQAKVESVERMAAYLVNRFNSPTRRNFYLKVAWHVPTLKIQQIVETSASPKIHHPAKFASYAFRKELDKLGVK